MRVRTLILGGLLTVGWLTLPAHSQVLPLGQAVEAGGVAQASCDCDSCGGGSLWGGYGRRGCGDPICGSTGLGYGGGFGSCDSCGVGGYFGRNIHPVQPCACGGSLVADLLTGVKHVFCSTMSSFGDCLFGGLQTASCHASGSFAAMRCAARCMSCSSCGSADCDGGMCGGSGCSAPSYGVEGYISDGAEYESMPMQPTPATESVPAPAAEPSSADPFTDDPIAPLPQASRLRRPTPAVRRQVSVTGDRVRTASYAQPVAAPRSGNMIGTAVQNALKSVTGKPALLSKRGYLPGKTAKIRR